MSTDQASPKKRKATGPHQAAPPPVSQSHYTSPPFSQGGSVSNTPSNRRPGHSRQRSDMSTRGDTYGRPQSRHHHTESSFCNQNLTSPLQPNAPQDPRRHSGGANPVSSILEHSDSRPVPRDAQYTVGPERREERRSSEEYDSRRHGNK